FQIEKVMEKAEKRKTPVRDRTSTAIKKVVKKEFDLRNPTNFNLPLDKVLDRLWETLMEFCKKFPKKDIHDIQLGQALSRNGNVKALNPNDIPDKKEETRKLAWPLNYSDHDLSQRIRFMLNANLTEGDNLAIVDHLNKLRVKNLVEFTKSNLSLKRKLQPGT